MILLWILLLPLAGAAAALAAPKRDGVPRYFAAAALAVDLVLLGSIWISRDRAEAPVGGAWIVEWSADWIPQLGVRFGLAMDGLALLMSLLTCVVGIAALLGTGGAPRPSEGRYTALLMALLFTILGVFLASDMALFFVFYELMLLPAFLLVVGWGGGDRQRTAIRFFLFTQTGGLLMLVSILGLYVEHARVFGVYSFAYLDLINTPLSAPLAMLFLCGFSAAFAVKLPLVPFHTWQPDAYANASAESGIFFSALMAKTAGFGLLRYAVPMFPEASERLAPYAMGFGVFTILYASWLAFGQSDLKRVIAYSSAAHLGYLVLGVFSMNELGRQGVVMQMVCHGLSVTGLFLIADYIERRTGTRSIERLGGLWKSAPRLGAISLVCAMATLGLPGLGNFIGEFLILAGTFNANPAAAAIAAAGAVLAAAYSLRLMQRAFFGPSPDAVVIADERHPVVLGVFAALISLLVFLGVHPQTVLDVTRPAADAGAVLAAEPGQRGVTGGAQ